MESKTDVELSVGLRYWADNSIVGFEEPEDFVLSINGEIQGCSLSETNTEIDQKLVKLGNFKLYRIQLSKAADHNESAGFVFDAFQETMDAGSEIFDFTSNEFRPSVQKMFSDIELFPFDDVLLLAHLAIHPAARGQHLGLAAIVQMMQDWSKGCSLIVMKPFPLQFDVNQKRSADYNQLELEKFPASEKIAFTHLRNYYQRLGFKKIGRSDFFAQSPLCHLPSANELGFSNIIRVSENFLRSAAPVSSTAGPQ